jgi:hypothetical protein
MIDLLHTGQAFLVHCKLHVFVFERASKRCGFGLVHLRCTLRNVSLATDTKLMNEINIFSTVVSDPHCESFQLRCVDSSLCMLAQFGLVKTAKSVPRAHRTSI